MRFNGSFAERTTASVGKIKCFVAVEKWTEEHNNTTSLAGSFDIHVFEFEFSRRSNFEVVITKPARFYTDTIQNFDNAVHFFNTRHVPESCGPTVQEGCAQKRHGSILTGLGDDVAREFVATINAEIDRAGLIEGDNLT